MDRPSRGGGPKKARPRQRRQADQLRGGPPHPVRPKGGPAPGAGAVFSHIQTISIPQAETASDAATFGRATPLSFVKKSLQEEIDEGIAFGLQPAIAASAGMAPLSFAQAVTAAMMPAPASTSRRGASIGSGGGGGGGGRDHLQWHGGGRGGGGDHLHGGGRGGGPGPGPGGGVTEAPIPKPKDEEAATVAGANSSGSRSRSRSHSRGRPAVMILPREVAPALSRRITGSRQAHTPTTPDPTTLTHTPTPTPTAFFADATPASPTCPDAASPSRSFYLASPPSHQKSLKSRRYTSETERSIIHKEDSDATKEKYESIMARLDDVFDAEEWEPDFMDAASSNSPEHLVVEPLRVTYTTVGSVAKSNSIPTFAPPVRIQREGANRRMPVLPAMRATDNFFARQQSMTGPGFALPNLNPYIAQHSQQHQSGTSQAGINLSLLESLNLTVTDQEKEVLDTLGYSPASVRSGNIQVPPYVPQMGSFANEDHYANKRMMKEETYGQTSALPGSTGLAGLNKMQTLQRLAQFDNPAQGFAKERLAEFKAVKMQQQQFAENVSSGQTSRFDFNAMQRQNSSGAMAQYRSENDGPLQSSRKPSYDNPYQHSQSGGVTLNVPPGYPQPLTAGPPGQRQNTVSVSRFNWIGGQNNTTTGHPHGLAYINRDNSDSPWFRDGFVGYDTHRSDTFRSLPSEDSFIRDTASAVDISQYYPAGFPLGFQMRKTRSMNERERQMNLLDDEEFRMIEQDLMDEMDNKRWYGGLDRFGMTVRDHVDEFEMREKPQQPGPIQLPTTEFLAARRAASVAEIEKMTLPEVSEPLIAAAFGTLLAYADQIVRPENRNLLSRFEPSPAWALDNSEEGRKSIFGDEWVAPPKRLGRDPRYQPSPLSEVWGNDGQSRYNY